MYPKHLEQYMAHSRYSNQYLLNEFLGREFVIIGLSWMREREKAASKEGNTSTEKI